MPETNWSEHLGKRARGRAHGTNVWIEGYIIDTAPAGVLIGEKRRYPGLWCDASTCILLEPGVPQPKPIPKGALVWREMYDKLLQTEVTKIEVYMPPPTTPLTVAEIDEFRKIAEEYERG